MEDVDNDKAIARVDGRDFGRVDSVDDDDAVTADVIGKRIDGDDVVDVFDTDCGDVADIIDDSDDMGGLDADFSLAFDCASTEAITVRQSSSMILFGDAAATISASRWQWSSTGEAAVVSC